MIGTTIRSTRASVADDLRKIDARITELTDALRAALEERATVEAMARLADVIDVESKSVPSVVDAAVDQPPALRTA